MANSNSTAVVVLLSSTGAASYVDDSGMLVSSLLCPLHLASSLGGLTGDPIRGTRKTEPLMTTCGIEGQAVRVSTSPVPPFYVSHVSDSFLCISCLRIRICRLCL